MIRTYLVYNTVVPEKQSSSHLSGWCAIVITTGKKVLVECIEFECNEFVLDLVKIDLIHFVYLKYHTVVVLC